jgi:hypothetical protein
MARIRTIKPEFWTDEQITSLPFEARLLYIGLWNLSDDYGKLEYRPQTIKFQIFPADNIDVRALLSALEKTKLIIIYDVDGDRYIKIPKFTKHQVISHPGKDTLPEPSGKIQKKIEDPIPVEEPVKPTSQPRKLLSGVFGEFQNVSLTFDEYNKLVEKFGEEGTKDRIENISSGIKSKGYKYKDHYAAIINWDRRDQKSGKNNPTVPAVKAGIKVMK